MSNKAKRLKVLHVIPSIADCRGGPSKAILKMVASLREAGVDAQIATTNDDGPFFNRFSPPINAVREFTYSGDFSRWLKTHINEYDILHIHAIFSYCSTYAMLLARKKSIPYIVRPIGQLQDWSLQQSPIKKSLYLRLLERANLESASGIHFTSEAEMLEAEQHFKLRSKVIPLGIPMPDRIQLKNVKYAANNESVEVTILYLSRLHQKKGLELLMQALARFKQVDFKLLIAGDGKPAYKDKLTSLAESLGLNKGASQTKCQFLGHVDGGQKAALLQGSDLFALTSHSENFGLSVLEAMAHGLTPIVSNGVALSECIDQHKLGLVCSIDTDDIESKLNFAFTHPQEIKSMGRKAQQYAFDNYSWPNIADQLKSFYKTIAQKRD